MQHTFHYRSLGMGIKSRAVVFSTLGETPFSGSLLLCLRQSLLYPVVGLAPMHWHHWGMSAPLQLGAAAAESLKVLPLKPGVGQYVAIHATLTARGFFFTYFYPSGPFTCIFSLNLSRFFPVLAVANATSCVGPQNEIGHPAGCRFPC